MTILPYHGTEQITLRPTASSEDRDPTPAALNQSRSDAGNILVTSARLSAQHCTEKSLQNCSTIPLSAIYWQADRKSVSHADVRAQALTE